MTKTALFWTMDGTVIKATISTERALCEQQTLNNYSTEIAPEKMAWKTENDLNQISLDRTKVREQERSWKDIMMTENMTWKTLHSKISRKEKWDCMQRP